MFALRVLIERLEKREVEVCSGEWRNKSKTEYVCKGQGDRCNCEPASSGGLNT